MSTLTTRRSEFLFKPAMFAFAFTIFSLTAPNASAQFGGGFQRYSERFYGQNFYDHQHNGFLGPRACDRQNHQGVYGPAQLYGRQYGDEYGYATARPFIPRQTKGRQ